MVSRSVTYSQRLITSRSVTRLHEQNRSALLLGATRTSALPKANRYYLGLLLRMTDPSALRAPLTNLGEEFNW